MLDLTRRMLEAAEGGAPVVSATVVEAGPAAVTPGSRLLVERDGTVTGSLGDERLDALAREYAQGMFERHAAETVYAGEGGLRARTVAGGTSLYMEVVESRHTFLVVGAGHIGRSLAQLGHFLGYHVAVVDDREEFADAALIPQADEVICDDFEAALDRFPIGPNSSVVMVTRGHKQDELALRRCLGRGAAYVGMIGSKRRTAAVLEHLRVEGFDPEELARVRTPIGIDIGAETPEEIALSIMAEVVLLRRGGSGGPMYFRRTSADGSVTG